MAVMMHSGYIKSGREVNRRLSKASLPLKGLTLVEVIISAVILGFIALSIYGVLSVGDMTWRTEMGLMRLQQEARLAMDGMTREIRQSKSSYITISGTAGNQRIDFKIYDPDTSSTYSISYYLNGNQIIREHPAGVTKVLARDINSLSFSLSSDEVSVSITAQKSERGRPLQFSLKEIVKLRNE